MFKKKLIYVLAGMALAALGNFLLFKGPSEAPPVTPSQSAAINWVEPPVNEKITIVESKSNCLLHKGKCRNKVDKKSWIEMQITPLPLQPNKALKVTVTTSDDGLEPLEVDFEGLNLNMGFIRPPLKKVGLNTYETKVVLPICDEKVMDWRALVLFSELSKKAEKFGSKFHFTSTSN